MATVIHNDFSMTELYKAWQPLEELQKQGHSNKLLIIDNRSEEEYSAGHSQNIPFGTESQHLQALEKFDRIYLLPFRAKITNRINQSVYSRAEYYYLRESFRFS